MSRYNHPALVMVVFAFVVVIIIISVSIHSSIIKRRSPCQRTYTPYRIFISAQALYISVFINLNTFAVKIVVVLQKILCLRTLILLSLVNLHIITKIQHNSYVL